VRILKKLFISLWIINQLCATSLKYNLSPHIIFLLPL
jgi:hypothetical protein